jgi:hypothetical protein
MFLPNFARLYGSIYTYITINRKYTYGQSHGFEISRTHWKRLDMVPVQSDPIFS